MDPLFDMTSNWKASRALYYSNIGRALDRQKRLAEAFTALDAGLTVNLNKANRLSR